MEWRRRLVLLGGPIIVAALLVSGCQLGKDTPSGVSSSSTVTSTSVAPTTSAAPTTTTPPKQHETIEVANAAGVRESVPFSENVQVKGGDTRDNPDLPALNKLLPDCGVWQDWSDVKKCVDKNNAQWYRDGIDRLHDQHKLYYSWSDVEKWAAVRTPSGAFPESRVIEVYGSTEQEKSKDAARAEVAGLIGADTAKSLDVIYIPTGFMNTWRTSDKPPAMTDFADYNRQVRVNIVPLTFEGNVWKQVRYVGGDFADCYNPNGRYAYTPPTPHMALVCPVGTILAGQPVPMGGCNPQGGGQPVCTQNCNPACTSGCSPPPCTTCTTTPPPPPPSCKPPYPYGQWPDCKDGAERAPNFPDSSGQNDTPGPGGYTPPAQMPQPPATQQAPPPAPAPAPVPDSHPAPSSAPLPPATGAPAPSAPATGTACAPGETSC